VTRHLEIRSVRGKHLQGLRAGFVSRAVASGTDVVLVLCVYVIGVIMASIAWDLFFSKSISVADPPHRLKRAVGVDPSRRVFDSRLVHWTHSREADDGLTSCPFRWESSSVLASVFSSAPLRFILPGASAGLGEPPQSRSRGHSLSDCGHLQLVPDWLRTAS
jgi:hypothetical protein